jgi:hypothetical protein
MEHRDLIIEENIRTTYIAREDLDVTELEIEYDGKISKIDDKGHVNLYDRITILDEEMDWIIRKMKKECEMVKNGQ